MLLLTAAIRESLYADLSEALDEAKDRSLHVTVACRRAELRQLDSLELGQPVTGDLLDAAGYFGYVDL